MGRTCTLLVNIPFVTGRCDYYGRALHRNAPPALKRAYLEAVLTEARWSCPDIAAAGAQVSRVAFCGGSLGTIEPDLLHAFLRELSRVAPLAPGCSIGAEVDPGLVSTALLGELRQRGLDLLRFHYLTSDPVESERMARPCSSVEMPKTRIVADSAGFHRFDMQVIVGLAGQTEKTLFKTLREAVLSDGVVHATVLTACGPLAEKDPSKTLALHEAAEGFLSGHGFTAYVPHCFTTAPQHRIVEELGRYAATDTVALGVGGTSRLGDLAWENTSDLERYIAGSADPARITVRIGQNDEGSELLRNLLDRLYRLESVPQEELDAAHGAIREQADAETAANRPDGESALAMQLFDEGLLEPAEAAANETSRDVRLNAAGRLRYRDVFARILGVRN